MRDHIEFFRTWAKDLRCAHGHSADADLMDAAMDEIEGLRARTEELAIAETEVQRLQAFIDQDWKKTTELRLKSAGPAEDGSFGFNIQGTLIPLIAEHLAQTFKAMEGENYVCIEFNHEELGPMMINLQRRLGEMPATKAARLAKEVERLRAALAPFASIPPVCLSALDETPLYAANYWCVVGRPDKSHFTREDLARARECLGLEVALFKAVPAASEGDQDPSEEEATEG
jgi:hypothetical protein